MATDSQRVAQAFERHYAQYDTDAVVQRHVAARLDEAIGRFCPGLSVRRALEIGIGTGFLTRLIAQRYPEADWWFNDLSPAAFDWIPADLSRVQTLPGDAEHLPYPDGLDLIAAASALQWFDNLGAFFSKAFRVMNPGGLLAVASFAAGHFRELSALQPTPLRYPEAHALADWAEHAGFRVLLCEGWTETLLFPTMRALLHHLRCTGVNGRSTAAIRTPAQLRRFEELYREQSRLPADGHLPLSYCPVILLAFKPEHTAPANFVTSPPPDFC